MNNSVEKVIKDGTIYPLSKDVVEPLPKRFGAAFYSLEVVLVGDKVEGGMICSIT